MSEYDEKVSQLQKRVQINPLDHASWLEMIRLSEEAISLDIDRQRWEKALKTMKQQARLMGVKI